MPPRESAPLADDRAGEPRPEGPRQLVRTWSLAVGGLAVAKVISLVEPTGLLAANLAGVGAFRFIALPDARLRARGESWRDHGLPLAGLREAATWRVLLRGVVVGLLVCAVAFPVFAAGFWAYAEVLPRLPGAVAHTIAPYDTPPRFALRLPHRLPTLALLQLVVVALPEELFYRGWMQSAWARAKPGVGTRVLGARLGAGFVQTQLLFALGHLVVWQPWRLATFFPGLLFGWVRARTGDVIASVVVHALSNLFIATLEASFYG